MLVEKKPNVSLRRKQFRQKVSRTNLAQMQAIANLHSKKQFNVTQFMSKCEFKQFNWQQTREFFITIHQACHKVTSFDNDLWVH